VELRRLVERQVDKLKALRAELEPIAAADRAEAADRAMFDDSKEGALFRRYETACERELHRAIRDLTKSRKERAKAEASEEAAETPAPEAEKGSEAPTEKPSRRHGRVVRNEPNTEPWSDPDNPAIPPNFTPDSATFMPDPTPPEAR
jgi:hypothetical protein